MKIIFSRSGEVLSVAPSSGELPFDEAATMFAEAVAPMFLKEVKAYEAYNTKKAFQQRAD